jgi:hypothetical protein
MTASDIDDALAADVGPLPNPKADRQAQKATPNAACFEQDLYAQESDDGRDNTLEAFCAIVEKNSIAASAVHRGRRRFPGRLSRSDRRRGERRGDREPSRPTRTVMRELGGHAGPLGGGSNPGGSRLRVGHR